MTKPRDTSSLWNAIQPYQSYIPPTPIMSALAILVVGAGVIMALPEKSDDGIREAPATIAAAPAPAASADNAAAPDESVCERQAWPYVDQRCAKRIEAARETRQVRIVTDKGNSVTAVTPVPIVEPKKAPAPVVAKNDRPMGPVAAPGSVDHGAPADKVASVAPAQPQAAPAPANAAPPAAMNAMARETDTNASNNTVKASLAPSEASAAPVANGVEALDEQPARKSRAAERAEKAEKKAAERKAKREAREAKRRQKLEENDGSVPDDVAAAVRSASLDGRQEIRVERGERRSSRRGRQAVPDEVVEAVEAATAQGGSRVVTVGSANGGQRIYLIPRDQASSW